MKLNSSDPPHLKLFPPPQKDSHGPGRALSSLKNFLKKGKHQVSLENFLFSLQEVEWETLLQKGSLFFQKNTFVFSPFLILPLCAFFLSSAMVLLIEKNLPPLRISSWSNVQGAGQQKSLSDYQIIFSRNLFSSQGLLPGEAVDGSSSQQGPAVKTHLELEVVGVALFENKYHSLVSLGERGSNMSYPVQIDDEIPEKLKVLDIEPQKIVFLNLQNHRKEYLELPEAGGETPPVASFQGSSGGKINRPSKTQFDIPRSEIERVLGNDLQNVLTQARAIPHYENGSQTGFKIIQIVPGSIYEELGIQNGDIILGANGSPINDIAKATEMFQEFKTAKHVELQLNKNGKVVTHYYDVR